MPCALGRGFLSRFQQKASRGVRARRLRAFTPDVRTDARTPKPAEKRHNTGRLFSFRRWTSLSRSVAEAEIGVFGGSGFYEFLPDVDEVEVETPFGEPAARPVIGDVGRKRAAAMAKHGRRHEVLPAQTSHHATVR